MKTNENGITLLSLVVTIVVLMILSTVLVNLSLNDNGMINAMQGAQNSYYTQKTQTETRVNDMTNGWEYVLK